MTAPITPQAPSIAIPEAYTFEGFCNRINCLASAMLRWPDGFRLRWIRNEHCPLSFAEVFEEFPEVEVTDEPGDWKPHQPYANYVNNRNRLCHYFLSTTATRGEVRNVYRRIIGQCTIAGADFPGEAIGIHYRGFTSRKKASPEACVDLALMLANRTGVSKVVLAADCDSSAGIIADSLAREGIEVRRLARGITADMDRTPDNVRDFISAWRVLTECRWAVSSAIWSTVLDASRALGNEVWTIAEKARPNNSCALFSRFGFDWLVADMPDTPARRLARINFAEEFGTRLICYSLYGNSPLYSRGMVRNVALAARHYPGWKVLVFHDHTVPIDDLAAIHRAGGDLIHVNEPFPMMIHRFLPAADPRVERILVRDADSRICEREAAAVQAWIDSDRPLHVMRDHPHHKMPVMGGMWGCKGGLLPDLATQLATFPFKGCYGDDQRFLAKFVWEPFHDQALIHDSHESGPGNLQPFPLPRDNRRFVGQRIGSDDLPFGNDESLLRDLPATTVAIPSGSSWQDTFNLLLARLGELQRSDRPTYLFGTHLEALHCILDVVNPSPEDVLVEFGGGHFSTPLLIATGARVLTVEQGENAPAEKNHAWVKELDETYAKHSNWSMDVRLGTKAWAGVSLPSAIAFAFVDGNGDSRKEVVDHLLASGVPVIAAHDSQQPTYRYDKVLAMASHVAFDFKGREVWTRIWTNRDDLIRRLDEDPSYHPVLSQERQRTNGN